VSARRNAAGGAVDARILEKENEARIVRADRATTIGLAVVALIWGANFSIVKVALAEVTPLTLNALRFPLASLVLVTVMLLQKGPKLPERRDLPRVLAMGVLGNVGYQCLFIFGLAQTRAGNASLLLATVPVWTLLLSVLLGHEFPSPLVWMGVASTFLGMLLIVGGGAGLDLGGATLRGDLLMVAAAIGWSIYTVGTRPLVQRYGPLRPTAWTLTIGTVGLVAIALGDLAATEFSALSGRAWFGVVYAGVLSLSVAYLLWYRGVERLGSARTAAYSNVVPVITLIVAWAWIGDRPSVIQTVGAAVILGGVWLARMGTSAQRS
jgi:drug/metabolite transporter (DMT)-like permease